MSGRYALFRWTPALAALAGFPPRLAPRWNIAPGQRALILRAEDALEARWGLTPAWLKDLSRTPAHARVESLGEQPMFRQAFASQRCLIPLNGFYEWRGARKRAFWMSQQAPVLFCAGLWERYPAGDEEWFSFAMVTAPAAALRRPVLLDAEDCKAWLAADSDPAQLLERLQRPREGLLERPLAHFVNDPTVDGPECLTPL